MKTRNRSRGFTMAEMLIVVAIIGVLAAVSFIAVAQHQRSLERLERDSVAREIFVAAQNHLTMAEGQGYLGVAPDDDNDAEAVYGKEGNEDGTYFFAVYRGSGFSDDIAPKSLLDLMLPFGSIDETVRAGGSYIISYHKDTATVLDVFYCSTDSRFGADLSGTDKDTLDNMLSEYGGDDKVSKRRNFTNGAVIGWYGGEDAANLAQVELYAPQIVVENADKLRIGIKNDAKNPGTSSLLVIVTGLTSGAEKSYTLAPADSITSDDRIVPSPGTIGELNDCDFGITLDDITTAGMHFADLDSENGKSFIPGEDVVIQAVVFDNTQLSNIAYSAEITVNSLYEKLDMDSESKTMTASVGSIRHLENLDKRVSKVEDSREIVEDSDTVTYTLSSAIQTSDLSWTLFKDNTNGATTQIQMADVNLNPTYQGCYLPVVPTHALSYDGQSYSVSDIKVSCADNAGMFGTITGSDDPEKPTVLKNLALIDFDITQQDAANANAGALAGTLTQVTVENVVTYSSSRTGITAQSGNAGGLIGYADSCAISKSASSLQVSSDKGSAGGLVGETNGGSISACYSGGHTNKGGYYEDPAADGTVNAIYNITATEGNAGGLIGVATNTPIDYSYSTCSVTGQTAGGFVAVANESISNCYATGLVNGTGTDIAEDKDERKDGAFAYQVGNVSNCYYYEIINEREDPDKGYTYLPALRKGNDNTKDEIKRIDADMTVDPDLASYNGFVRSPDDADNPWAPAYAYDSELVNYYSGKYNLKTVAQLGADGIKAEVTDANGNVITHADFVSTHYGDWPAPEIFVLNAPTTGNP